MASRFSEADERVILLFSDLIPIGKKKIILIRRNINQLEFKSISARIMLELNCLMH